MIMSLTLSLGAQIQRRIKKILKKVYVTWNLEEDRELRDLYILSSNVVL